MWASLLLLLLLMGAMVVNVSMTKKRQTSDPDLANAGQTIPCAGTESLAPKDSLASAISTAPANQHDRKGYMHGRVLKVDCRSIANHDRCRSTRAL